MKTLIAAVAAALLAGVVLAQTALTAGEVVKVDKSGGKLTLKHEELKNLDMPAMTMNFRVTDRTWLDGLAPGQKVRFVAEKVNGQYTVVRLEK